MLFDKNNLDYNGEMQKAIWDTAANLVPLEVTLPMIPEDLREPCIDFYNFSIAVLEDMYQDAEEYKDDDLFFWYFIWLYKKFKFYDDAFVISIAEYKKFVKKHSSPKIETLFSRHGMEYKTDYNITGECVRVTNNRYPGMMKAVFELLAAAYQNYNVNCGEYLFTCDFRALVNYKRTYSDTFAILNDKARKIAEQIVSFAAGIGVKPIKNTYFNRVEFKQKGKIVFILDVAEQRNLKINIGFAEIGGEAFKMIENEIEKYDDAAELKNFWRNNIKKCTNCRGECAKRDNPIEVLGGKSIVCQTFMRLYAPEEQDLKHIFKLIELRAMVVKAGISEVFYPGN